MKQEKLENHFFSQPSKTSLYLCWNT